MKHVFIAMSVAGIILELYFSDELPEPTTKAGCPDPTTFTFKIRGMFGVFSAW